MLRWATEEEYGFVDWTYTDYPGQRKIYIGDGEWSMAIPDDLPTCDYCGMWDAWAIAFGPGWCGECGQCINDCECEE